MRDTNKTCLTTLCIIIILFNDCSKIRHKGLDSERESMMNTGRTVTSNKMFFDLAFPPFHLLFLGDRWIDGLILGGLWIDLICLFDCLTV